MGSHCIKFSVFDSKIEKDTTPKSKFFEEKFKEWFFPDSGSNSGFPPGFQYRSLNVGCLKWVDEENSNLFGVACDYWMVDNYEEKIERKSSKIDNISCGIMYRRDLFVSLGGYNPLMRHREEEELR